MKNLVRMVPVAFVMGTIFFLSHQSGDSLSLPSFPGADKLAHMTAYGVLALSMLWAFGSRGPENPGRSFLLTLFFCLLYGMSDEYHQSFIPLRSVSGYDLLADVVGAVCVGLIWLNVPAMQRKMLDLQNRITWFCLPN